MSIISRTNCFCELLAAYTSSRSRGSYRNSSGRHLARKRIPRIKELSGNTEALNSVRTGPANRRRLRSRML